MVLKNKDGSPYRLSGPNRLASTQTFFDRKKVILHNCHWDDVEDDSKEPQLVRVKSDFSGLDDYKGRLKRAAAALVEDRLVTTIDEIHKSEEPSTKKSEIPIIETEQEVAEQEVTEQEVTEPEKPETPKIPLDFSVLFHCLPAVIRQHRDSLYGDQFARLSYGKKFIFQGVVLDSEDLVIRFWTTDPNHQITEKSIVFPYQYENGIPYDEYRWWQVQSLTPKTGGYIFEAIPSSTQPDFSD